MGNGDCRDMPASGTLLQWKLYRATTKSGEYVQISIDLGLNCHVRSESAVFLGPLG